MLRPLFSRAWSMIVLPEWAEPNMKKKKRNEINFLSKLIRKKGEIFRKLI